MKSITSVSSLTKNFFDSWKIRSLSWKFHDFCFLRHVLAKAADLLNQRKPIVNRREGQRSAAIPCSVCHTRQQRVAVKQWCGCWGSQIYPLYSALQQLHRHKEGNHYSEPRPVNRPATWGARQLCRGPMRREVRGQERGQGVGGVFETGGAGWGGRGGGLMLIKLCVMYFSPHYCRFSQ